MTAVGQQETEKLTNAAAMAVVLGLVSVRIENAQCMSASSADATRAVSHYFESVDSRESADVRGVGRRAGEQFEVTVDPSHKVTAAIGEKVQTFAVSAPAHGDVGYAARSF